MISCVGDPLATPTNNPNWQGAGGGSAQYGRNFRLMWLKLTELPFTRTQHLHNPYNENKPVKVGRDCQEIEPSVGVQLVSLLYQTEDSTLHALIDAGGAPAAANEEVSAISAGTKSARDDQSAASWGSGPRGGLGGPFAGHARQWEGVPPRVGHDARPQWQAQQQHWAGSAMFHGGGNVQHPQYLQHPQHPQHQYQQQYQHQYQPQPSWGGGAASGWAFPAFPNGPMAPQVSRPSAAGPPAMPPAAMMMFPEEDEQGAKRHKGPEYR